MEIVLLNLHLCLLHKTHLMSKAWPVQVHFKYKDPPPPKVDLSLYSGNTQNSTPHKHHIIYDQIKWLELKVWRVEGLCWRWNMRAEAWKQCGNARPSTDGHARHSCGWLLPRNKKSPRAASGADGVYFTYRSRLSCVFALTLTSATFTVNQWTSSAVRGVRCTVNVRPYVIIS